MFPPYFSLLRAEGGSLGDETESKIGKAFNKKGLNEDDSKDDKNRGKVYARHINRERTPDPVEHRLCCRMEKSDNWIVRVRINPGDDSPSNDDPHIESQYDIDHLGDSDQEIRKVNHRRFITSGISVLFLKKSMSEQVISRVLFP